MGEVLSFRKIQIAVVAAIAAFAMGFAVMGAQNAYADEGQYQAGTLAIQKNAAAVTAPLATGTVTADAGNKATYTVTGEGTVAYKAPTNKKATSVTIPATITVNGTTYKVTSVAANAFKGDKKLKKVTIGTNVTTIGKNAFQNCTKLSNVTVGKNVKTIGKNAFKGAKKLKTLKINSKKLTKKGVKGALKGSKISTVKVPKAKVKAYKKIFTKKNCGKKVTVKKK